MRLSAAVTAVALALSALIVAGCGASGDGAVAKVDGVAITKAALSHWMSTIAGGDYYEALGREAPTGLVSEPANYPMCLAAIESVVPPIVSKRAGHAAPKSLLGKCRQLHEAIRRQTLTFLIVSQWSVGLDAAAGIKVSNGDAHRQLMELRAERFPKLGQLKAYLDERHWTLSDELFILKRDLLSSRLQAHQATQTRTKSLAASVGGELRSWTAKTICAPDYVVEDCREYKPADANAAAPSAAAVIEELGRLEKRSG